MNTFIEIRTYDTLTKLKTKSSHNIRNKNLSQGIYANDGFINLVEKYNDPILSAIVEKSTSKTKSRSYFTNEISKSNHLLKKYNAQLIILKQKMDDSKTPLNLDKLFVAQKKYDKKFKSIEVLNKKINDLVILRDSIAKNYSTSNSQKNRKPYVEFVLTITDVPPKFKRSIEYRDDLKLLVNEYMSSKNFKFKKLSSSMHMDQSNPHCHLLVQYDDDNNLQQDLQKIYSKDDDLSFKTHYNMQSDFNDFVKSHSLVKKLDWEIEGIKKGGAKDYKILPIYKSMQKTFNLSFDKIMINELKKHTSKVPLLGDYVDYEKILKKLEPKFKKLYVEGRIRDTLPDRTDKEYKAIYEKKKGNLIKSFEDEFKALKDTHKEEKKDLLENNIELKRQNQEYLKKDKNNSIFTNKEVSRVTKSLMDNIKSLEDDKKLMVPKSELEKYKRVVEDNNLEDQLTQKQSSNRNHRHR